MVGKVDYLFCYGHDLLNLPIAQNIFSSITVGKYNLVPVTIPDQNNKPMHSLPGTAMTPLPFVANEHESIFGQAVDQLVQDVSDNCFLSLHYEKSYIRLSFRNC